MYVVWFGLYRRNLVDDSVSEKIKSRVDTILRSQNFTKELPIKGNADGFLRFNCIVMNVDRATIHKVKKEAGIAVGKVYTTQNLMVGSIVGYGNSLENDLVTTNTISELSLFLNVMKCLCEDEDEDEKGQLMGKCNMCENWMHGTCIGYEDAEMIPSTYMCKGCFYQKVTKN
ncbi:hypothetical protein OSB04_012040 [Centaurea solstitialis]|uniref:Zinc finger PHD-type domain-containing protein n=1 Tax=Centaurea solstitialis TaxID=347529 RepID=A0AA38TLD0_9ASTR|nr:hypothetical protein OSB04_012040 [Centaurea solstitialis]